MRGRGWADIKGREMRETSEENDVLRRRKDEYGHDRTGIDLSAKSEE